MKIKLDTGTFVLTKNDYSIDVFSTLKRIIDSGIIPIPVEGDVQIFANEECTELPNGMTDKVYAKFNTSMGVLEEFRTENFYAGGPTEDFPDDPYCVMWNIDFMSQDFTEPFTAGQVVELTTAEPIDVTGWETTFYKPQ